jgi:hypothetical protein
LTRHRRKYKLDMSCRGCAVVCLYLHTRGVI